MENEYDRCSIRIIKATYRLLQKGNSEKTSINNIAKEAGTNSRTIYRKFENKKDIIDSTKEYYLKIFLDKINDIFSFNDDEDISEYLNSRFMQLKNLPDSDFGIIKIAIEEVNDIPEKKSLISRITNDILVKLQEFFKFQKENENIKDTTDIKTLSIICFSIIFQSLILSRIYEDISDSDMVRYSDQFLDILYNGIKPE